MGGRMGEPQMAKQTSGEVLKKNLVNVYKKRTGKIHHAIFYSWVNQLFRLGQCHVSPRQLMFLYGLAWFFWVNNPTYMKISQLVSWIHQSTIHRSSWLGLLIGAFCWDLSKQFHGLNDWPGSHICPVHSLEKNAMSFDTFQNLRLVW